MWRGDVPKARSCHIYEKEYVRYSGRLAAVDMKIR